MRSQPAHRPGEGTLAVHGGGSYPHAHHALTVPIVETATYTFRDTADLVDFMDARLWQGSRTRTEYGRYGNPTVAATEAKIAALDGAEQSLLYASGMAAVTTVLLSMLRASNHMIITDDAYRRTRQFCKNFLSRFGISCSVVQMGDYEAIEAAITPDTRLIVSESPTNPYLRVLDLERLAQIGRRHKVRTLIDSTFATPINQRPLEFGIDLVLHSATKYLSGHNDMLAGVVSGAADLIEGLRQQLWVMGAVVNPHAAYLLLRGLKTLALRVARQNENGMRVSAFLEQNAKIERVWYPGLPSHPDHEIAARQMTGFGGVISFEVRGDLKAASRLVDAVRIPLIAPSLGGVESLIEQPALMSYYEQSTAERLSVGIKDNLVRMALGIEDAADLIADLEQALAAV
ncbi:MAG: aminotransferase class I/II-fold pyridoxal phosphate-dependent enzyme [Candidatus Schekmanbacteria bacterium]|nr:aminotransferase class I/II-fold pyridoxal phosphate-dependent enzyme [Candidatus Schekmanbacteria bacterium]